MNSAKQTVERNSNILDSIKSHFDPNSYIYSLGKARQLYLYSAFHAHVQLNVLYIYNNRKDNKELK